MYSKSLSDLYFQACVQRGKTYEWMYDHFSALKIQGPAFWNSICHPAVGDNKLSVLALFLLSRNCVYFSLIRDVFFVCVVWICFQMGIVNVHYFCHRIEKQFSSSPRGLCGSLSFRASLVDISISDPASVGERWSFSICHLSAHSICSLRRITKSCRSDVHTFFFL